MPAKEVIAWLLVAVLTVLSMGLSAASGVLMTDRDRLAERLTTAEGHVRHHMARASKAEEDRDEEQRTSADKCEVAMFQLQQAMGKK